MDLFPESPMTKEYSANAIPVFLIRFEQAKVSLVSTCLHLVLSEKLEYETSAD